MRYIVVTLLLALGALILVPPLMADTLRPKGWQMLEEMRGCDRDLWVLREGGYWNNRSCQTDDGERRPIPPSDPVDPVDPGDPVDPVDPVDPGDGGDPTDPGDGGDPTDPGDGGDPTDPGDDPVVDDPVDPGDDPVIDDPTPEDPVVDDPAPEDPVDEPVDDPKDGKDNNGHGNGDEGDCSGSGCDDPDNPGKKPDDKPKKH